MPSRIMHYCVVKEILKRKNYNFDLFLLGNLAPDAHDHTKEGNYVSHFRLSDEKVEEEFIDLYRFINKHMTSKLDHFILGYYCHLITDNMWLKDGHSKYKDFSKEEKVKVSEMYYKDYKVLNNYLIDYYSLSKVNLYVPKISIIEEINYKSFHQVIDMFNDDFHTVSSEENTQLLSCDFIISFIQEAAKECILKLNNLRI